MLRKIVATALLLCAARLCGAEELKTWLADLAAHLAKTGLDTEHFALYPLSRQDEAGDKSALGARTTRLWRLSARRCSTASRRSAGSRRKQAGETSKRAEQTRTRSISHL
ncbi:MAG TPA: hypothetical protein VFB21_05550 [Chthonomonadaceae bacterium]|nr:hypothetical protein [Chthonomonadaceae bacterium]